jgi:hypothetical protein
MGADDDLEDWDDGIELKSVPKKTTNNWGFDDNPRKKNKYDQEQDNDTLGFLKQAEAEK